MNLELIDVMALTSLLIEHDIMIADSVSHSEKLSSVGHIGLISPTQRMVEEDFEKMA